MKITKTIFKAFLAVVAMAGIASCSSEDYERIGAPGNAQVYFSKDNSGEFLLEENQNAIEVEVERYNTAGELTVTLTPNDETGLFTIPTTVTFADGQAKAKVPVTFDFSALTPDTPYEFTLAIDKAQTSEYADGAKTFVVKYAPWTDWVPFGWKYPATVSKDLSDAEQFAAWETIYAEASSYNELAKDGEKGLPVFTYNTYYGGDGPQPVFIRQSALNPSQAQLMLYDWGSGIDLVINWDTDNNEYPFTFDQTYFTNNSSYGAVYISDAYYYWNVVRKLTGEEYAKEAFPCKFDEENGRFTFHIAYYVSAGTFGDGEETLQLPGYEKADYSLSITDNGLLGGKNLGRVFDFQLGADVASVKYAAFKGELTEDEVAAKAEEIFDGSVESVLTKESGNKVLMGEEGTYTLVAVIYDADGARVGAEYITYEIAPVGAESWTPIFVGDYTYTSLFGDYDEETDQDIPFVDEDLVLFNSDQNPNLYKIEHWGQDVDYCFTMTDEGEIHVLDQYTGFSYDGYGDFYVMETIDALGTDKYGVSSYDPSKGLFTFANCYYYGTKVYDVALETYQLTAKAQAAVRKAMAKAKATPKNVSKPVRKSNLKMKKAMKVNQAKMVPAARKLK